MQITLLLFGQLADITGTATLTVNDVNDTDALVQYLNARYPLFQTTKYFIAVDKKMIRENEALNNKTVVALLPPFSGG